MARIFIRFKKGTMDEETLSKALSHKYIRRIPKLTGKGWNYIYKETFQKPIQALKELFGITEKKLDSDYEKNNIQKDYGADKKTFAAHVLEFFTNKTKWTNLFSKKEAQQKYKKPVKQSDVNKKASEKGSEKPGNKDNKKGEKKSFINRSLMRKVWTIYSAEGKAVVASEETEKAKEISVKKENEEKAKEIKEESKTLSKKRTPILGGLIDRIKKRWGYIQKQREVIDSAYTSEAQKDNAWEEEKRAREENKAETKTAIGIMKNTDKAALTSDDIEVVEDALELSFSNENVVDIDSWNTQQRILAESMTLVRNTRIDRENKYSRDSIVKRVEAYVTNCKRNDKSKDAEHLNTIRQNYLDSFKNNKEAEKEITV